MEHTTSPCPPLLLLLLLARTHACFQAIRVSIALTQSAMSFVISYMHATTLDPRIYHPPLRISNRHQIAR
jgi:hypothetical protein